MFNLPDLIIESVLREGFENLKNDTDIIEEVFGSLTRAYSSAKYGAAEIERIKAEILKKDISFVHAFNLVEQNTPCVSIQLMADGEDTSLARLEDYEGIEDEEITDSDDLAALVKVSNMTISAYNAASGTVSIADGSDLSQIHVNQLFEDTEGNEFPITGGIINTSGAKQFTIAAGSEPNISGPGQIKSSFNYTRAEIKGIHTNVQVLLGIHSKEALMCKYLYTLVKYVLLSRKRDLISRGLILATFQGSDFTRNMEMQGDITYSRFLTISGKVQDYWRGDQVALIDNVEVTVLVDKDELDSEDLELDELSVQIKGE